MKKLDGLVATLQVFRGLSRGGGAPRRRGRVSPDAEGRVPA